MRASQSIPLNIAEGNGKTAEADRRRYFEIARGSALECAAILDVLLVGKALDQAESSKRKTELDRMAAMLTRLGGKGYGVREEPAVHGSAEIDFDFDSDFDLDDNEPQQKMIFFDFKAENSICLWFSPFIASVLCFFEILLFIKVTI